ncbi:MAG: alanine dehydrogenase, partial [Cyclobacteriaceae bacterium]
MIKIGIIKEGKTPTDRRAPFSPTQCANILATYKNVELKIESSADRCFSDDEYKAAGVPVVASVNDCDILFGVKEVPIKNLLADKTYFFFSHTIKKQAYNRNLLQEIIQKNITLIDYECLKKDGNRVVAFGRFAGIVGAYNACWTYGKKHQLFDLKRAYLCKNMKELFTELKKVKLPNHVKLVITGGG